MIHTVIPGRHPPPAEGEFPYIVSFPPATSDAGGAEEFPWQLSQQRTSSGDADTAPFGDGSVRSIPPAADAADASGSWGVSGRGDRLNPPAPDTPAVSDIAITKQSDIETPFYLKLEGVDGDVSAPMTERASNLIYSGESAVIDGQVNGNSFIWGLDRIDQVRRRGGALLRLWRRLSRRRECRGERRAIRASPGGVFVAAGDVTGDTGSVNDYDAGLYRHAHDGPRHALGFCLDQAARVARMSLFAVRATCPSPIAPPPPSSALPAPGRPAATSRSAARARG